MAVSIQISSNSNLAVSTNPKVITLSELELPLVSASFDDLDLDSRLEWNTPSIREFYWQLLRCFSDESQTILLNPNSFHAAQILFNKINNISPLQFDDLPDIRQYQQKIIRGGKFIPFQIDKDPIAAEAVFHPSSSLPQDIFISTPLTFPYDGDHLLLTLDKSGWWNPLGGHMENNETWEETLKRESVEEGGAEIDGIKVFGYIQVTNTKGQDQSPFPPITQIPMTISRILSYQETWTPMETTQRQFFDPKNAFVALKSRTDGGQMLQIYSYLSFLINSQLL